MQAREQCQSIGLNSKQVLGEKGMRDRLIRELTL